MPGRCDSVFVIILDTMYFVVSQKNLEIRKSKKRENVVYNNYNSIIDYIFGHYSRSLSLCLIYPFSPRTSTHADPIETKDTYIQAPYM